MRLKNYSKLIRKKAQEIQRRRGDNPNLPVEQLRTDHPDTGQRRRRVEDKPEISLDIPKLEFKGMSKEDLKEIHLDKLISNVWYASVVNKNTKQPIRIGKIVIENSGILNEQIKQHNQSSTEPKIPTLEEDLVYHLEKGNIVPFSRNVNQNNVFVQLFELAKNGTKEEVADFEYQHDTDFAEMHFMVNRRSHLFASMYRNKIIRLAKQRKQNGRKN